MTIAFEIPYEVAPKQSTRIGRTKTGQIRSYPDAKVVRNGNALAALIAPYRPKAPLEGPLSLSVVFVYPWLKKHTAKRREDISHKAKDTRPDLEQLLKQLNDVLERSGFMANDAQVSQILAVKRFGDQGVVRVELSMIESDWGEEPGGIPQRSA